MHILVNIQLLTTASVSILLSSSCNNFVNFVAGHTFLGWLQLTQASSYRLHFVPSQNAVQTWNLLFRVNCIFMTLITLLLYAWSCKKNFQDDISNPCHSVWEEATRLPTTPTTTTTIWHVSSRSGDGRQPANCTLLYFTFTLCVAIKTRVMARKGYSPTC